MKRHAFNAALYLFNGAILMLNWIHNPWWLAFPLTVLITAFTFLSLHALCMLRFEQGKLSAALELQQHGAETIYRAIVRQIVSNAPNN